MTDLLPPGLLDRFEPTRLLGAGAFGRVVAARDRGLDRPVAIKLLHPEHAAAAGWRERFSREAQLAAGLDSPHIAAVYDHGVAGDVPFIVFQMVDGPDLARVQADAGGRLPFPRALELTLGILRGLAVAHGAGVVHRDLKPGNVLLHPRGHPVIADFGLARQVDAEAMTRTGVVMGTVEFMAPEQMTGEDPAPGWDLYAAALTLFVLASGTDPFRDDSFVGVLARKRGGLPHGLREEGVPVPPALDRALRRALDGDPARRHPSATELADALADASDRAEDPGPAPRDDPGVTVALSPASPSRPPRQAPRRPGLAAGLALLVAAGLGALLLAARDPGPRSIPPFERIEVVPTAFGRGLRVRVLADGPGEVDLELLAGGEPVETHRIALRGGPTEILLPRSSDRPADAFRCADVARELPPSAGADAAAAATELAGALADPDLAFRFFEDARRPWAEHPEDAPRPEGQIPRGMRLFLRPFPDSRRPTFPLTRAVRAKLDELADHLVLEPPPPTRALRVLAESLAPALVLEHLYEALELPAPGSIEARLRPVYQYGADHALPDALLHRPLLAAAAERARALVGPEGIVEVVDLWELPVPPGAARHHELRLLDPFNRHAEKEGLDRIFRKSDSILHLDAPVPREVLAQARAPGRGLLLLVVGFDLHACRRYQLELLDAAGTRLGSLPLPLRTRSAALSGNLADRQRAAEAGRVPPGQTTFRAHRTRHVAWAWIGAAVLPAATRTLRVGAARSFPGDVGDTLGLDAVVFAAARAPPLREPSLRPALDPALIHPDPDVLPVGLNPRHLRELGVLLDEAGGAFGFRDLPTHPAPAPATWRATVPAFLADHPVELLVTLADLAPGAHLIGTRDGAAHEIWAGYEFPPASWDAEEAGACDDGAPATLRRVVLGGTGDLELALRTPDGDPGGALLAVRARRLGDDLPLAEWDPPLIPSGMKGSEESPWGKRFADYPFCR